MKKNIAILLVLVMLIGIVPLSVYASSDNDTEVNLQAAFIRILEGTSEMFKQVASKFTDMGNHWADVTIGKLVELKILDGYSDGSFKPNNTITRGEFSKVVRAALELEIVKGNSFDDTTKHWAKDQIHTLVLKDIIVKSEYGTNFVPNKNITRIEMAKMIVRAVGLDKQARENANASTTFKDNGEINGTDRGYVLIASENKIISGYPDGTFRPNGEATRAEASKMIVNMFNALERGVDTGEDTTTPTEPISPPTDDSKPISTKEKIAHLYDYKAYDMNGKAYDIRELNKSALENGKSDNEKVFAEVMKDGIEVISLLLNRDYKNIPSDYEQKLLYHIYGTWYYRNTKYYDSEFPKLWIDETKNWKVQSQSQFLTSDDLIYFNQDGRLTIRGVLRIKYDNHENPNNIQYELSKKGQTLELGKWYEVDIDMVLGRPFTNIQDRKVSSYLLWQRDYLSDFREVE